MAKCYTRKQVLDLLHYKARTFERKVRAGELPYVEVLQPSAKNHKLYRADLIDRYLAGEYGQSQYLNAHKRTAARRAVVPTEESPTNG